MSGERREVVLGADIGGTSTRVAIASRTPTGAGEVWAVARGGAGNPNAVGLTASAARIAETATAALEQAAGRAGSRLRVRRAVIGMAGYGAVTDPSTFLTTALPGVELSAVRVVPDFAVAFASATPAPAGCVVLAGTGAGAVQISDGELTGRRDAWGWLLGDLGSGFWLGREAVRATLSRLERGADPGPLGAAVLNQAEANSFEQLVAAGYAHPPIWLASLAPTVAESTGTDPEARRISEEAAGLLLDALLSLDPDPTRPVVTTGSVLQHHPVIAETLRSGIAARLGSPVRHAASGLAGALWLAAKGAGSGGADEASTDADHARFVAAVAAVA